MQPTKQQYVLLSLSLSSFSFLFCLLTVLLVVHVFSYISYSNGLKHNTRYSLHSALHTRNRSLRVCDWFSEARFITVKHRYVYYSSSSSSVGSSLFFTVQMHTHTHTHTQSILFYFKFFFFNSNLILFILSRFSI